MSQVPEPLVFDCGCRTEIVEDTFILTACRKGRSCLVVKVALEESEAQGKLISILEIP